MDSIHSIRKVHCFFRLNFTSSSSVVETWFRSRTFFRIVYKRLLIDDDSILETLTQAVSVPILYTLFISEEESCTAAGVYDPVVYSCTLSHFSCVRLICKRQDYSQFERLASDPT